MHIIISNSSNTPIYQQIVNQIKEQIMIGVLKEEECLPSIRGLAKELRISVITTKKAYEELEREGYIFSVGGKGNFVAPQNSEIMHESRLKQVEDLLMQAHDTAKLYGLSRAEVFELLNVLYEEEEA